MNIRKPLLCIALAAIFGAGAQQINPITKAILAGYDELLQQNPKDYETLYERGAQYYRLSQYDRALNDLTKAVEYTPEKETALKVSELSLISDAAVEMQNYELALKAISEALAIEPDNYGNIYKRGNVYLLLKNPEEAYRSFSSMQRLKSRSQEAYFGMAKASAMMNKKSEAEDLLKEAEAANPTSDLTYCRLGDLYQDMEEPQKAASNYLIAFTMSQDPSRALNSLIALGKKNYPAVADALNYGIEKSNSKESMLYLKGSIANSSGYYADAKDAFGKLAAMRGGQEAGVYYGLAKAEMADDDIASALVTVNKALNMQASPELYTLKSQILAGQGNYSAAAVEASKAVTLDPDNTDALTAKAEAQIGDKDGMGALSTLNELLTNAPDNCKALLLRAYVFDCLLDNGTSSVNDCRRLAQESPQTFSDFVYKSIGQVKAGKKMDADAGMEEALSTHTSPEDMYYAAVYYAQTDNLEKGIEFLNKAIYEGYQNKYNVLTADTPWMSVAPLRRLLKQ